MINFNDTVIRIIDESRALVFPPELEEAYESIIKHIESNSAPREWSQGIYMPKEIIVGSCYNKVPDFPEREAVVELLKTDPGYTSVSGGIDGLRNYINVMVTNGVKADKISKKYPEAYSSGSLSADFQYGRIRYNSASKGFIRPLKNDNDIKKMFYDGILNSRVNIPPVPKTYIKINLNGVKDALYVNFVQEILRKAQILGYYKHDNDNIITINLPLIMSTSVKISSVKDFSTQWPKSYSSTPKMDNLTVSHILQMFDTRNTKRVSTVDVIREVIRHELMHYYESFFKQKNIVDRHNEIEIKKYKTGDQIDREAFIKKKERRAANYLTHSKKITGRIAAEFYPRLRELLETVPKDALEGFLRTLDIKPLNKFYFKSFGIKHIPTDKTPQSWERWLAATLKVPYLKRKLLEKIYNFVNA